MKCVKATPLKSSTGNIMTNCSEQKKHWAEHNKDLYSRNNVLSELTINAILSLPFVEQLDETPTEEELSTTIACLFHGKATGSDCVPVNCDKLSLQHNLHELLCLCLEERQVTHKISNRVSSSNLSPSNVI